ncbi:Uncharacterized membrane protein YphA, DoxX/SURF4 family [Pustulibacterium marinum]|uniref:Uncharacterized membrane protein YphA, DoxX/SURF4 family n=1 Tax=Pustulibacterium marinum TaxID=1224947 RepID=A0A1I7FE13_9FLAO|nr:BT_3928 family protein [Pustulibacterium marinum]SFU34408.1 Uncharacterized membrane protein YphA, DoxX/SURF4 family [Pustulibacterium marinum]
MKIITNISRFLVGILFIVSGFVKLVDPMGFSFKLQEYFSEAVLNLTFLEPYALWISLFVVIFELLLGVMLLVGFKRKFTLWSLLLMIVFFTFLTFYSAYFNKVTDCGCFGDAVKLSPWGTFWKDVVLLVLILILFAGKKYIKPVLSKKFAFRISLLSLLGCCVLANYVLQHLPIIDFRPYKVGNNITEGMIVPEDAPEAVFEYAWKFDVNGEEKIIKTTGDYPKVDGELLGVETTEIEEGYHPPIHDFTIERDGEDYTQEMMQEPKLIIMISYDLELSSDEGLQNIKDVTDKALKSGYKVIAMTSSSPEQAQPFKEKYGFNFDFYFTDMTTLKTIVRSNPGLLKLNEGTIVQKLHYNDADELEL